MAMKIFGWVVRLLVLCLPFFMLAGGAGAASLAVTPGTLTLKPGGVGQATVANVTGSLRTISSSNSTVATVAVSGNVITVTGKAVGTAYATVRDTGSSSRVYLSIAVTAANAATQYTLVAWNDLGMHCMDSDYSVFSILPPYNNLHAQLVDSSNNKLVSDGVTLSFEAMADGDGSVNSYSQGKTNFWEYAQSFFNLSLPSGIGLTGYGTAGFVPQALKPDAASGQFIAEGIPITPYDDSRRRNPYPMTRVVARDAGGTPLAEAHVVLPVSDEMTCIACHASSAGPAAKPISGWVNDPNLDRDYRRNILRLHDEKNLPQWKFKLALKQKGYDKTGLLATADLGRPILCAACHASNALPGTGIAGIKPLTEAIHGHHAEVKDATTGMPLGSSSNRASCYQCHPGQETQCLRGAMGKAVAADGSMVIQCQNCHGAMSNVGRSGRTGWLEQPNCQACHHDGQRETAAVGSTGVLKTWADTRFATNPDTPKAGFSLYRFSKGHGKLQCSACHGSTHAEYPSAHANDNVLAREVQGHEGTLVECGVACHKTAVPMTADGGPHGMHTVGATWVSRHASHAGSTAARAVCATCHGSDFRGTFLSQVKTAKTFTAESRTVPYVAGQKVGCYDCHNGPTGGN